MDISIKDYGAKSDYDLTDAMTALSRSCGSRIFNRFLPQFRSYTFSSQTCEFQRTVSKPVSRSGIGLHTGVAACLKLLPAAAGEGRYFVHSSNGAQEEIRVPSSLNYVVDTTLSTTIGLGGVRVQTIEHLLSALEGLGVDNCRIEIEGGTEVPILDGSAKVWVDAVNEAGISFATDSVGNRVARSPFVLTKPIFINRWESFVAAFPSSKLKITYGVEFEEVSAIKTQWFSVSLDDASKYEAEVAPARTFCIAEQVEKMKAAGLIKGGSLQNAMVCSIKGGWINPPLRFVDEPCRHKLLDLIGDLALCARKGNPGLPIAHIIAFKGGHSLNVEFGHQLFLQ